MANGNFIRLDAHAGLRLRQVLGLTDISRSTLYTRLKENRFPQLVRSLGQDRWVALKILELLENEESERG